MKKICFVTTVSITIKAFLLQFTDYLVNEGYDVTFICSTDESMYKLCNDHIHYIPVPMKRGVGFDGLSVINKLTKIFKKIILISFSIQHQIHLYMHQLLQKELDVKIVYIASGESDIWDSKVV